MTNAMKTACWCTVYGPHIFHTNSQKIWNYLSRFTRWRAYSIMCWVSSTDAWSPIPFNLNTLYALFPQQRAERVREIWSPVSAWV